MSQTNISAQALVSDQWLAEHLDDPQVRVLEVSSSPSDAAYREGHIPGAAWWFWKDALWHPTDREFVTPERLAEQLGRIGISPETTLVLYGDPVQYGTYAFWTISMAGHKNLRLLDGSRKGWLAQGRSLSQEIPNFAPVSYPTPAADPFSRVGRDEVRAKLGQPGRLLLDVRSPEEYRGERVSPPPNFDHGAERTGRIPGAQHLFYRELVNEDDTFLAPEEIRAILDQAQISPDSGGEGGEEIVTYCRLSHRATMTWFALRYLLGRPNVRVYDGSWTEWGSIVGFPIEK